MAYLMGLASVAVVFHHSTHWIVTAMVWWTDRYQATTVPDITWVGSWGHTSLAALDMLAQVAVPCFLFVSGYSIAISAGAIEISVRWKVVAARLKSLISSYLLWSIIVLLMNYLQGENYSLNGLASMGTASHTNTENSFPIPRTFSVGRVV